MFTPLSTQFCVHGTHRVLTSTLDELERQLQAVLYRPKWSSLTLLWLNVRKSLQPGQHLPESLKPEEWMLN